MEIATEKALAGALIGDPELMSSISHIVNASDFSDTNAALVFAEVKELYSASKPIDIITVTASGRVSLKYVAESTEVGYWSNGVEYAKQVAERSKQARIRRVLAGIADETSTEMMLAGITKLYNAESAGCGDKETKILNVVERFDSHVQKNVERGSMGLYTGINALEDAMIYYVEGQIWVMGGYTSTGKTAMMVQMIVNLFRQNKGARVELISTEMTEEQMVARILGNMTGIYSQKILAGNIYQTEIERYELAKNELLSWNLKINDTVNEYSEIESVCRRDEMQGGVDIVFIDYVQNCKVNGITKAYEEQKYLATSFQQLAKTVDATLVCLSQVSNDVGRGNVDTFELKGAGEWAAVADVGIMLKRGIKDNELAFIAPKNRHGKKPSAIFEFSGNYSQLIETDEQVL